MADANAAIKTARMLLNDINGTTWGDQLLMPLLQQAHSELVQQMEANSMGVVTYETSPIVVPPLTLVMPDLPTNIINPVSMMEREPYSGHEGFIDMVRVSYIPQVRVDANLSYWAWMGEQIRFVGAVRDREVILRYEGTISTPQNLNDPIGIILGETYIGPRIAALAKDIAGADSERFTQIAEKALWKIVQSGVHKNQRPVRNRAYRSPKPLFNFTGNITVPISGGGSIVTWISTLTPPDGVRDNFDFPYFPRWVSWNGVNQFEGTGYTLAVVNGKYNVTFKDVNGNLLIPGVGDDIREAVY